MRSNLWFDRRSLLGAAIVIALAHPAWATCRHQMVAMLNGMQEVPANGSAGFGCARILVNTQTNTLSYYIVVGNLSAPETAAHIHGPADPGLNAGVLVGLPAGSVKTGVWNYPEAIENDILAGRTYINVHTAGFPGGEVRGQIVSMVAELDAVQEVPPNASPARGFGLFTVNRRTNTMRYYIAYGGLTGNETAAHIHGFAPHGTSAGVLFGLPAGSPKTGTITYTDAQEENLKRGLSYVNIHTVNFPGGEIRGQITPNVLPMDPTQEVPPNGSPAIGCELLSMDLNANIVGFDIRHNVGSETAAHFHGFAPPGVNAGVLFGLPAGPRKLGQWVYAAAQEANILDGLTYTNIHSTAFPGGEVRGQNVWVHPNCVADIDGDGVVGQPDLGLILSAFGSMEGDATYNECADLDNDGKVDQIDLGIFLPNFGLICPD